MSGLMTSKEQLKYEHIRNMDLECNPLDDHSIHIH